MPLAENYLTPNLQQSPRLGEESLRNNVPGSVNKPLPSILENLQHGGGIKAKHHLSINLSFED